MAKLFFYYSTMNAGKSTNLLQASYNYKERGFNTLIFNFHGDLRQADGSIDESAELYVTSRLGIKERAHPFDNQTNMVAEYLRISEQELPIKLAQDPSKNAPIGAILIDEAQFLSATQVKQLAEIVDDYKIPVLCYGIRSDFLGNPFEGSSWLLTWADEIVELKTICATGKKATFVLRVDDNKQVQTSGNQVQIGGNNTYIPVSRKIFREAIASGELDESIFLAEKVSTD